MRVLQVTAIPVTAVRFVAPLAEALGAAGHDVEIATGPGRGIESLAAGGRRVHALPLSRSAFAWSNLHALGALRSLLRAGRYDVLHTHTPAAATVGRLAARRSRVRVVYTMHGSLWGPGIARWRRALYTWLERWLGRGTDLVFTVNPEDAVDCVRIARIPAERVRTLPAGGAGVDPKFFLDGVASQVLGGSARDQLGIAPDELVLGYMGRTAAAKGIDILARAFQRVAERERKARLLVVGGGLAGERRAFSERRFRAAVGSPEAERVVWRPFREDVAAFMAACDVVVLPSRREGFGMILAEAAALGRPTVATETRGARCVIEHGVSGLLIPLDDAEALAAACLQLLQDRELAARMGAAARRRAEVRFSREAVLSAYLEGYEALVAGSSASVES